MLTAARAILLGLVLLQGGCWGRRVGDACTTTGSGFSLRDPCQTTCLSLWHITCPDGRVVNPHVCAGRQGCVEGQCPPGQVCYRTNVDRSFCIPDDICPTWRTDGVADPVLESDEEVRERLFKKRPLVPVP
jgi:hypothetical protein